MLAGANWRAKAKWACPRHLAADTAFFIRRRASARVAREHPKLSLTWLPGGPVKCAPSLNPMPWDSKWEAGAGRRRAATLSHAR